MDGLDLANRLFGADHARGAGRAASGASRRRCAAGAAAADEAAPAARRRRPRERSAVSRDGAGADAARPRAPRAAATCRSPTSIPYLNLQMLLGKHLGRARARWRACSAEGDAKTRRDQRGRSRSSKREAVAQRAGSRPTALYRFFEARPPGDDLILLDRDGAGGRALRLPAPARRRAALPRRLRARRRSGEPDYVALFAVTCGAGVRELAERWKERGRVPALPRAPGARHRDAPRRFAEMLHARLRTQWGFPDPPEHAASRTSSRRTTAASASRSAIRPARTSRTSASSSTCCEPEQIGLALTEGFMMDPEASVSALVFHHPEAKYFKAE